MTTRGLYARGRPARRRRLEARGISRSALWTLLCDLGAQLEPERRVPIPWARWRVRWWPVQSFADWRPGPWFTEREAAIEATLDTCTALGPRALEPERITAHAQLCARLVGSQIDPDRPHLATVALTGLADVRT